VAGVSSGEDASLLKDMGVDLLGFPLRLAHHTPDISEISAQTIIRNMYDPSKAVLITYLTTAEALVELVKYLGVSVVQLHADIPAQEARLLRESLPQLTIS